MANFFNIAILGPRASGKTIFISSLLYSLDRLPNEEYSSRFYLPHEEEKVRKDLPRKLKPDQSVEDINTVDFVKEVWEALFEKQDFSKIQGTFANQNLHYFLESKNKSLVFYDIPGGWFEDVAQWGAKIRGITSRAEFCGFFRLTRLLKSCIFLYINNLYNTKIKLQH